MKKFKNILLILLITILLAACGKSVEPKTNGDTEVVTEADNIKEEKKDEEKVEEKAEIDELTGMEIESEEEIKFAKSFDIKYLKDGFVLIDMKENSESLLLVPEGKEAPKDIEGLKIIQKPIERIAANSTTDVAMLKAIGELDKVNAVTTDKGDWYIDGIDERIDSGDICYIGKSTSPDYELLQSREPDIVLLVSSQTEAFQKVRDKLTEIGLNWSNVNNNIEDDPRGRIEWAKFFGALVDNREAANKYFDEQINKIEEIESKTKDITDRKTAAYFRITKDGYTVKKADDYSVKMLELAGADYGLSDIGEDTGITKVSAEDFIKMAENIDILIHENMGAYITNMDELLEHGDHLADLLAVKNGDIWTTDKNYWQSLDKSADMIMELYDMIYGEDTPDDLNYYHRIK
ncbi:MAG: ABC transporter substrate-binding protein [Tissierellia bacterium]|nr:ABC transporter substrate-binding protein [Tissierellia bacterium]